MYPNTLRQSSSRLSNFPMKFTMSPPSGLVNGTFRDRQWALADSSSPHGDVTH